ncbi:hypothetical protein DNTS_023835 [Danionella cerebrum]|uniref:Protein tyrosine phosphatase type IVA 3 n=1 Tax=Danionella cerebrum TaxID=2873325 RepID=A0A553QSV9_9TELE|nr:hypothetical protein DNTS_023835 [Danionella translucida]TRY93062.1 hypothetical protein DNTS_023835 [Danionella translucida]
MARMNRPAPVEVCYKNMRFLITHNPTNSTLSSFIEDLKKYGVTTVVRVCEITYDKTPLEKNGITVVVGMGFHVAGLLGDADAVGAIAGKRLSWSGRLTEPSDSTGLAATLDPVSGYLLGSFGSRLLLRSPLLLPAERNEAYYLHSYCLFLIRSGMPVQACLDGMSECLCGYLSMSDWTFDDGAPPPSKVVEDWLSLLKRRFLEEPGCCIAVHCVAGLGRRHISSINPGCCRSLQPYSTQRTSRRAPVLVAVALIESGMKYEDAIQFIRQKRRGAINSKQLTYLEKYRPKQRLRYKHPHIFKNKCCIM